MGKLKNKDKQSFHNVPLVEQLSKENSCRSTARDKKHKRGEDVDDEFVENATSKKILNQAREQRLELELEQGPSVNKKLLTLKSSVTDHDSQSESEEEEQLDSDEDDTKIEIDEETDKQFEMFSNAGNSEVLELIKDKKTEIMTQYSDVTMLDAPRKELSSEVVKLYSGLGKYMQSYRSGQIPKAFKMISKLRIWEEVLEVMHPEHWSAAAIREVTKQLISNFKIKQAAKFLETVLLPRVRDDIAAHHRLSPHLITAVKKALFKPEAFFEGFLIPLCKSGTCSNQEATILSESILKVLSIPMQYSAAALIELTKLEGPYSSGTTLIISALIDKKYSLPLRVISDITDYFLRTIDSSDRATVIWHQCLLVFVQRYKNDLTPEQKQNLISLTEKRHHRLISEEICRELSS